MSSLAQTGHPWVSEYQRRGGSVRLSGSHFELSWQQSRSRCELGERLRPRARAGPSTPSRRQNQNLPELHLLCSSLVILHRLPILRGKLGQKREPAVNIIVV